MYHSELQDGNIMNITLLVEVSYVTGVGKTVPVSKGTVS